MKLRCLRSTFCAMLLVAIAGLIISGCGGKNPVSPGGSELLRPQAGSDATFGESNHILWGMWGVEIDPATRQVDMVPLRGAMFNANVVKFLQPPTAPIQLVVVTLNAGSDFTTGHIDLDVTLKHPFPGIKKFRGFDVRGIVMGDGSMPFSFDPTVFRAGPNDLTLENADGWTRWWNPTEFTTYNTILGYTQGAKAPSSYQATATINAYKYFADGLGKDSPLSDMNLAGRGSFATDPGINTRRYILQFPGTPGGIKYKFSYAVDASWALPDPAYMPDFPPEAYPPQANTQEAWRAAIDDSGTTAWYVNDLAKGGSVQLSVEVFDWQGATNSNGVADEVSAILLDCPLFAQPVDLKQIGTAYPGGPVSSVWVADISDLNLISAGTFGCWMAVQADDPSNYAPQIQGDPSNFAWPDAPLRSYWFGTIDVSSFFPTAAPTVTAVIPSSGTQSTVLTDVEIDGTGFQSGASVKFAFDATTELSVTSVAVVDQGVIKCDLDCSGPLGKYDVTVTNPDTQQGTLDDGFEVVQQPADELWWKSHMYNAENIGQNPTVPGADPWALQLSWVSPVSGDKKYCTPVVADNKIYFTGNDGFYSTTTETFHCFDLNSGQELWSKLINPTGVYHRAFASPVWWRGPDGVPRVAVGGDEVYCYNADTGDQLWAFDDPADPLNIDWISNPMKEYKGMVLARSRESNLYVVDFVSGGLVSTVICASGSEGGCGAKDDKVYISSAYHLECADIMSGLIIWSTMLPNAAEITHWIDPTIVGDRVYVSTYQGYVFCAATKDDGLHMPGDIIWSWNDPNIMAGNNPLVGGTSAAVVGGETRLFAAAAFDGNYVYCIADKGDHAETVWQSDTVGYFDSSPIWSSAPSYSEGVVYCPDREGSLDAFDAANGHLVWQFSAGTELRAGVSAILNMLVVTSGTDVAVFKGP